MFTCKSRPVVLTLGLAVSMAIPAHCFAIGSQIAAPGNPNLRIHLARFYDGADALVLANSRGFSAILTGGGYGSSAAEQVDPGHAVTIEESSSSVAPSANLFSADRCDLAVGQTVTLTPLAPGDGATDPALFTLQRDAERAHHYRGALDVTALSDGTLRVVDILPIEDYLKGVVGPEMGLSAPLEALKAQAIAARTYAIKNRGKCTLADADLDDTTNCQDYLGFDSENWRCRTAVDQTAGEVLTYDSSLIDAVYATDCGGMTGEGDAPYLKPVADKGCSSSAPWTLSLTLTDLQASLLAAGIHGLTSIASVSVGGKDASGRVLSLTFTDSATRQAFSVAGPLLRKALGYDRLRSTLFEVAFDRTGKNCVFTGRGWGHGMGMCQDGAIEMARSDSAKCDAILLHYYTGVSVSSLTPDILTAPSIANASQSHRAVLVSAHAPKSVSAPPVFSSTATTVTYDADDVSWGSDVAVRHGL